ncbi:MAG TPA: hypothetical protein VJC04_03305 [Candidatus Paceibacterota bacterium]
MQIRQVSSAVALEMPNGKSNLSYVQDRKLKMKTYTFAAGTFSPGFVLSKKDQEVYLGLGEYGPGSFLNRIPLNLNPANQPDTDGNIIKDAFLLNVSKSDKPFFILVKDNDNRQDARLIRFFTQGGTDKGNGFVQRISGWRSKELTGGHGRNSGLDNGTWSDTVWVVAEGELLKVQLGGSETAFAVRVKNGEPTVQPWVNREAKPEVKEVQPAQIEIKPAPVASNGNGRGRNPHQWRTLAGSHVVVIEPKPVQHGLNDEPEPKIDLDAEIARLGKDRVAKFQAKYKRAVTA